MPDIHANQDALRNVETETPDRFEITRIGQKSETVRATSLEIVNGDAPKYVFRKDEETILEIFVHALEIEPVPKFAAGPDQPAQPGWNAPRVNDAKAMPQKFAR